MRTEEPRPFRLKDYRPPDWLIETVDLDVSLDPTATIVRAKLWVTPNSAGRPAPLILDGEDLKLRFAHVRRHPIAGCKLRRYAGPADHRAATSPSVRTGDRNRHRSRRQQPTDGSLPGRIHVLHAMRGRRLSPHHLFPRPSRCDGGLHHAHRGRQNRGAGAARQRQPYRPWRCARRQ